MVIKVFPFACVVCAQYNEIEFSMQVHSKTTHKSPSTIPIRVMVTPLQMLAGLAGLDQSPVRVSHFTLIVSK